MAEWTRAEFIHQHASACSLVTVTENNILYDICSHCHNSGGIMDQLSWLVTFWQLLYCIGVQQDAWCRKLGLLFKEQFAWSQPLGQAAVSKSRKPSRQLAESK